MANSTADLAAGQIVRLTHGQTHLYATVIQVLEERSMAWLRPLLLAQGETVYPLNLADLVGVWAPSTAPIPDMVWPIAQLAPALDTEVLPLLTSAMTIGTGNTGTGNTGTGKMGAGLADAEIALARSQLKALIRALWTEAQTSSDSH
jgi:hypothetical protein